MTRIRCCASNWMIGDEPVALGNSARLRQEDSGRSAMKRFKKAVILADFEIAKNPAATVFEVPAVILKDERNSED